MSAAQESSTADRAGGTRTPADYASVTGLFAASLERAPEATLFRAVDGTTISYVQAGSRVLAAAGRLDELGLRRGDILICFLDETVALGIVYLACAVRGVLAAPLSPSFSIAYLRAMGEQLGTVHVLTTPPRAAEVRGAGLVPICFEAEGDGVFEAIAPSETTPIDEIRAVFAGQAHLTGEDALLIQPTSGSTGRPKQVIRRHAALSRYAHFLGDELGSGPHRFLMTAALTHAFGCHMYATALSLGAEIVMPEVLDVGARLADVRALDPTVMPMTPRVLRAMCRQYVFAAAVDPDVPLFGPSAQFVLSAGGRSEPRLLRFIIDRGLHVIEFYGSSEASVVALTPRGGWREGWAGRVLPDVTARIAPDTEVLLSSPGMMAGYLGDPELTAAAYDADGFYETGDLGEIDGEGYLRILGRKKDVFNTPEGSNIHPERIELLIESLGWASQVMLVGDQLPYLTALITLRKGEDLQASGPFGRLSPDRHGALYRECGDELDRINDELEEIERIRVFLLFNEDFPEDVYKIVGPAKARRSRKVLAERYADPIAWMYAYERLEDASPTVLTDAWMGATNALPGGNRQLVRRS